VKKNFRIDSRLDSYQSFFDHDWSQKILNIPDSSDIREIVFDLSVAWKGAANTHVMPWLMATALPSFYKGLMQVDDPFIVQVINSLPNQLEQAMEGELSSGALEKLRSLIRSNSIQLGMKRKEIIGNINLEDVWKDYFENTEFRLSIWASQRLVYGAIYYAYEEFLLRCYQLKANDSGYQIRFEKFKKDFATIFGESLRNECWLHDDVAVARLTRNALVHNGGRIGEDVNDFEHQLCIENGAVQIMPEHNKRLFNSLKKRALKLTKKIVKSEKKP